MKWQITVFRWVVALLLIVGSGFAVARHVHDTVGGRYGQPEILHPTGTPKALVLVFPDPASPDRARTAAHRLVKNGALVAVIDTGRYLDGLSEAAKLDCTGLGDDAEHLGKHLLRDSKIDVFLPPLLVGDGEGALLVRQTMAAAAPDVLAGAVVVDDIAAKSRISCGTQAPSAAQGTLAAVSAAVSAGQLAQAAEVRFPATDGNALDGLPLVEMHVPGSNRLAIIISGDGGWRELDKGVAAELNRQGVSVVGWNSLRYFWSEKTPQQIADDLGRVMTEYQRRWQVNDVALVGYSFGADVMPFAYQRLPEAQRQQVNFVSLLGLAHGASFRVRVGGWLGLYKAEQTPILPELAKMPPALLQCIHGEEEKGSLCPELEPRGIEVVARPGGHHFDHDPTKLATIILQGWQRRLPVAAMHA
jgi:type IV secretory pathway VirJ component